MATVGREVLLLSLACVCCLLPTITVGTITIENNGYRGVDVVIHEDIPEDPDLLETIKEMLKRSSPRLYEATGKRAYLEEVTIVLPSTWSSKPTYKTVPDDDYLSAASVRIAPPHPSYNHTPYTKQPGGCGEFGRYIHFTPDFFRTFVDLSVGLRDRQNITSKQEGLAKIFLHEWFHLRYGVFNEFPDATHPTFYRDSRTNKIHPNVCPATVSGRIRQPGGAPCIISRTGKVIGNCTFFPTTAPAQSGPSSVMFMPQLQKGGLPCEDDNANGRKHNEDAPNEHNDKCGRRSVRNVMESGPDFRGGRNPRRDITSTEPRINVHHLKKDVYPGYVLILDVSGSMNGKPWEQLKSATSRAIKYKAKSQCPVGMVSFSDTSKILAQLTPINPASRGQLLSVIPPGVGGYTAIGQGLQAGLKVLGNGNNPVDNGKLILITDGEENRAPNIVDVIPELQRAKVIVYGLAFGNKASLKIEDLCRATGGKGWSFDMAHLTQSVDSMLDEIFQNCGPVKGRPVINKNGAFKLLIGDTRAGSFYADRGVAKTTVYVSYDYPDRTTNDGKVPTFTLTSPSGRVYTPQSPEYNGDPTLKTMMYEIPNAEPGKWTYNIANVENNNLRLNLMITSDSGSSPPVDPIRVNSWISDVNLAYPQTTKIYAELKKGQLPVLNANVTANIFKPNGDLINVPLKDNGIGADAVANDGIYTEFYTQYNGDGRYAIDITVDNQGGATTPTNLPPNNFGAPEFPYLPEEYQQGPVLSEFLLSDLQQVDEEFETSALGDENYRPVRDNGTRYVRVDPFERFATSGTFILSKWVAKDLIAPGRIRDLMLTAYDSSNRIVTLRWTAPGDDMFFGQAAAFEVHYHPNVSELVHSFDGAPSNFTILNGTLLPLEAYQVHVLRLQLPPQDQLPFDATSDMIYFAVRALDKDQNVGELSNLVLVNLRPPMTSPTKDPCRRYLQLYSLYMRRKIYSPQSPFGNGWPQGRSQAARLPFGGKHDWELREELASMPRLCQSLIWALEDRNQGEVGGEVIDSVSHVRRQWWRGGNPGFY